MSEGLLKTKLFAPAARPRLVVRQDLLDKLDAGFREAMPFTLVSAPAGFGKTTLIGDWVRRLALPSGWLTLDSGDNDPVRFWRYVDAAMRSIDESLGEDLRPALFSPQPPAVQTVITGIVNDIVELGKPFVLVLEDYHLIERGEVHASVNFLLDHLPPTFHLVITTRSDPPLNLALRRGRRQISELRAAELRFSRAEISEFFNQTMPLGLAPEDLDALEDRTEGWIAGLQMAGLSLQDEPDPHAFVMAFRGDDRYIADYLIEEVLQRQPQDFQRFLLQTSFLNRLCAPLCDAITGRQDSQAVLNALERANLFIHPLDNRREWFRYHQLFAHLLNKRQLDIAGEQTLKDLKRAASQWYEENGYIVEAVENALSIGDFDQASTIIERSGSGLFMGPELNNLQKWIEILPEAVIANRPGLNIMGAWANHATGHPDGAERMVQVLEERAGISVDDFLETLTDSQDFSPILRSAFLDSAVVRTRIAVDSLDLERAFSLAEMTLPHLNPLPPDMPYAFNPPIALRCAELFNLGVAHQFRGELGKAVKVLEESVREAWIAMNPHIIALALGHLGEVQTLQGSLNEAQITFLDAIAATERFPSGSSAFWGIASVGLGVISLERNDLKEADRLLKEGLELGKLWNSWECMLPGMTGLAIVHAARGRWDQAFSVLKDLEEIHALNALPVKSTVEWARARLQFWQGNRVAAKAWAMTFQLDPVGVDKPHWMRAALLSARIWLGEGNADEAISTVDTILEETRLTGCGRYQLEGLVLRAEGLEMSDRLPEALLDLQAALALAEPEGFVRLFIDEGEGIERLLKRAHISLASHPKLAAFASRLLLDMKAESVGKQPLLVDSLTERELEVLAYIAQGLTNPEIAERLYLSPNTLKAHAQNIYSKLDVHNRLQAANKAKALGLISK